jgi:FkbM family methyltransferase
MQRYLSAIRLAPNPARAHLNHGNILLAKGDLKGALDAFRTAIKHNPDYAGAYYNMGNALLGNGQIDEAVANYRRALEINPDYAEVHCVLGVALKELGHLDGAVVSFRKALEINPDLVEARTNLGNVLQGLYNMGNVLLGNGKFDDAVASFRRALEIEPNLAEAHYNLGNALKELGQLDAAVESFRRALEIKPDYPQAHFCLGLALQDLGQFDNAVASYRRALEFKPDIVEAHNNLGLVLQELGQLKNALASYRRALEIKPDFTDARNNLLFILNYTGGLEPSYYLEQARQYGRIVAEKAGGRFSTWQSVARPKRLRVGLVSGDLRIHSVGNFLEGLLSHIDLARIELIAYPTHHKEDELTARIRPYFSAWKPLFDKNDEAAARLIHADGVHVLLDVSGHTAHNRLPVFAWKPAPVQVSWLGLPNTTGVSAMDYVLGDSHAIPPEHENHFSETVWRLPDSYLCFSAPAYALNVAPLPALSAGHVTFGSFNNLTKMNDAVVELWARILLSVPNSRLYLKTGQLHDADVREQTRRRFAAWSIAPERLLLGGTLGSIADHLSEYNKIDVALDTFPYPGVTTSVEALWMGVPVMTLHGDRFLSLTAKSIAHHAGLPDWVAVDKDNYVAKAVAFTSNLERLAALRAGLRQQVLTSPLFDAPRFARNFEDALWGMWQAWSATHAESGSLSDAKTPDQDTTSIPLANGIRVTVPRSPQHMTTFVLHEQHDWFEDEINFVRHFVRQGMRAIDIGANFGLYALNIAKIIGDSGKLWAFEPAESTASCLNSSISENNFNNIVLIQAGLSDRCEEARLFISSNSELNSLSQAATGSDQFEIIDLLTLDSCREKYGWDHIDFIKMDAEGEELNILKGGEAFLSATSPLIMFELMHGQEAVSLPLVNRFLEMGYNNYRLAPALNILIPFDHNQPFDESVLNLFCCKEDCAVRLERDGVLVRSWEEKIKRGNTAATEYFDGCAFAESLGAFSNPSKTGDSDSYPEILNSYLASLSDRVGGSDRVGYLMSSLSGAVRAVDQGERSVTRLVTFARIAIDAGERSLGVKILGSLIAMYQEKLDFEIDERFLPAAARYDGVHPGGKIKEWLMSSVIEQYIVKHAFSAYFTGQASLPLFEKLHKLGFMNEEMQKRHEFVKSVFSP